MSESLIVSGTTKKEKYESLLPQIQSLVEGEADAIANISNIIAALKFGMDWFWVGVYFVKPSAELIASSALRAASPKEKGSGNNFINGEKERELVLGPFQGPVACTRIALGKGVCGAAWKEKKTIVVEDVDKFPGHIACSSASKSEIVLPIFDKKGDVALVLDVDSEHLATFDETDKIYLEKVVHIITQCVNF